MAFTIDADFPRLRADERLLKQIMLNLVSNATKFTPEGGHVAVRVWQAEDGAVLIAVADDGIGIAQSDLAVVLLPFGQVESAMSRKHEGTGLGLPLSKGFMELHGGSLALSSQLGHGTEVMLTFPAERTLVPEKSS